MLLLIPIWLTSLILINIQVTGFWTQLNNQTGRVDIVWTLMGDDKEVKEYIIKKNGTTKRWHIPAAHSTMSSGYKVDDLPPMKGRSAEYILIVVDKSGIGIVAKKSKYLYK